MTGKEIGIIAIVIGGGLQIVESMEKSSSVLNGTNFNQTTIGSMLAPIENVLPFSLGWTIVLIGAALVWIVPIVKGE